MPTQLSTAKESVRDSLPAFDTSAGLLGTPDEHPSKPIACRAVHHHDHLRGKAREREGERARVEKDKYK